VSVETPPPPQVSPDGKFYWDGERWVPMQTPLAEPAPVAQQLPDPQPAAGLSTPGIAPEAVLQEEVNRYTKKGFRVVSQTSRSAQLVKPKKFSFWWALIWTFVMLVGLLVYLFYYAAKKDRQVYLTVDDLGRIATTKR
jgi:hypothetical protein